MSLSRNAKESIKVAGALVIAYGIALSLDWDKPYWAGFAVAVCSQINLGQSLGRVLMRVFGTLLALLAAWIIFAVFPQDRWLFMVSLSLWIGACIYFLQRSHYEYFWIVSAFVTLVLWNATGGDFTLSFEKGIFRIQETVLGVVVYSLVAVLIWPNRSRGELDTASTALAAAQHRFGTRCFAQLYSQEEAKELSQHRLEILQADTRLRTAVDDASFDSYEIWECRRQWRHYGHRATAVTQALLKLEESLALSRQLRVANFFTNLNELFEELNRRLTRLQMYFSEGKAVEAPVKKKIEIKLDRVKTLSTFDAAALTVTYQKLKELELETRSLVTSVQDIRAFGQSYLGYPNEVRTQWLSILMPDPDRIASVLRVVVAIWIAYLAYIFIPDMIDGLLVVTLTGVLGSLLSTSPMTNLSTTCLYTVIACIIPAPFYFFLLPKLSSYYMLGSFIFIFFFSVSYITLEFFEDQPLVRMIMLLFPNNVFNLANHQTYDFINYANLLFSVPIIFAILAISKNIPFSLRPENKFKQTIKRFFHSAAYLISTGAFKNNQKTLFFHRLIAMYHINIVITTPKTIQYWRSGLDITDRKEISEIQLRKITKLVILTSNQIKILYKIDNRKDPLNPPKQITQEVLKWRSVTRKILLYFSGYKHNIDFEALEKKSKNLFRKEIFDTNQLMSKQEDTLPTEEEIVKFLYFLGVSTYINSYLTEFFNATKTIDWRRFCENRFL
ncbi:FUSC family protein [Microbulbifer sp. 2304DJ12-6]|uniref:FUSC family protein n=1 Tax=Microbulbifer sp. 2304DJ12-6 TaxID=3233340 RepID=UPI0039AF26AB